MALGSDHIVVGEVGNFIPEMWSDEIIASYKPHMREARVLGIPMLGSGYPKPE